MSKSDLLNRHLCNELSAVCDFDQPNAVELLLMLHVHRCQLSEKYSLQVMTWCRVTPIKSENKYYIVR